MNTPSPLSSISRAKTLLTQSKSHSISIQAQQYLSLRQEDEGGTPGQLTQTQRRVSLSLLSSETCFVCGKAGHYARNCRQNKGNSNHTETVRNSVAIHRNVTERRARSTEDAVAVANQARRRTKRSTQRRLRSPSTKKRGGRVLALRADLIP